MRDICVKCVLTVTGLLLASADPAQAQTADPPSTAASAWSVGGVTVSGLIDGYYNLNFNHPASGANNLRNFDVKANQFSLNMAKLVLEHSPEPAGFRVDMGFGRAFEIIYGSETEKGFIRNIEQAFVSFKPERSKGLQLDFGKFVTSAGAEVIETHSNWNYSRSLLFAWAIPYYHFGARVSMPFGNHFTAGVQLVNGWNNVEDNNSGKTVGLTAAFTSGKVSWFHSYYAGPEKARTNEGYRHLYDTVVLLTPTNKASFYVNFDYGVDEDRFQGDNQWVGIAGAARFAVSNWFALSPRIEWFNDKDGFSTGTIQRLKEFTMTGEFKMRRGVLARLEYRRDWSSQPFFDRGDNAVSHRNQDTILAGFVAYFGGPE